MPNYYEVLGVSQNATQAEIKRSYWDLVRRFHPDRNPGDLEFATRMTQLINEAYNTLKDPVKRLEYDMSLTYSAAQEDVFESNPSAVGLESTNGGIHVPEYRCQRCGRLDSSLRATVFLWVLSLGIVTFRRGWGAVLCSRCRLKYSILFNMEVCLLGWWGIPWGIIFSIEALARNSVGGIQPEEANAALLASVTYDLYRQGRYSEAFDAGQLSLRLQPNAYMDALVEQIRPLVQNHRPNATAARDSGVLLANIALVVVLIGLVVLLSETSEQHGRQDNAAVVGTLDRPANLIRLKEECEGRIHALSQYLRQRLPFEISREANRVVYTYKMDYGRLEGSVVGAFCEGIWRKLPEAQDCARQAKAEASSYPDNKRKQYLQRSENALNFIVAAAFSARVLESAVRVINELQNRPSVVEDEAEKLTNMLSEYQVRRWLSASGYLEPFNRLLGALQDIARDLERIRRIETFLSTLEARIEAERTSMRQIESSLRSLGPEVYDYRIYNSTVQRYNAIVQHYRTDVFMYNEKVTEGKRIAQSLSQIDVAQLFNDCLDPKVLFREFHRVDLGNQGRAAN
ncbi:MAG: DnaJ domain-containing protein [Candidatus Methanomethyliaceae archaeon]